MVAATEPVFVIVIFLGVPISAVFRPVLFTDNPSVKTLAESVVAFAPTSIFNLFAALG